VQYLLAGLVLQQALHNLRNPASTCTVQWDTTEAFRIDDLLLWLMSEQKIYYLNYPRVAGPIQSVLIFDVLLQLLVRMEGKSKLEEKYDALVPELALLAPLPKGS